MSRKAGKSSSDGEERGIGERDLLDSRVTMFRRVRNRKEGPEDTQVDRESEQERMRYPCPLLLAPVLVL
jgi:hypothetical protein